MPTLQQPEAYIGNAAALFDDKDALTEKTISFFDLITSKYIEFFKKLTD